MKIEIWSDVVCLFCYIGFTQFNKALDQFEYKDKVNVIYRSFQLNSDVSSDSGELKAFEQLARAKGQSIEAMRINFSSIEKMGRAEGLEMRMLEVATLNTFKVHKLIHFASRYGKGYDAMAAAYGAYFSDVKNVAESKVLLELIKGLGLNVDDFNSALSSEEYNTLVDSDISRASRLGVRGVPAFVADGVKGITGARGVEAFRDFLDLAWRESRVMSKVDDDSVRADESCVA